MSEQNYSTAANFGKAAPSFPYYYNSGANNGSGLWKPFEGRTANDPSYWTFNNYTTGTVTAANSAGLKSSVLDLSAFAPLSGGVERVVIDYTSNSAGHTGINGIVTFAAAPMSGLTPQRDGRVIKYGGSIELSPSEYAAGNLLIDPIAAASGVFAYFTLTSYKRA